MLVGKTVDFQQSKKEKKMITFSIKKPRGPPSYKETNERISILWQIRFDGCSPLCLFSFPLFSDGSERATLLLTDRNLVLFALFLFSRTHLDSRQAYLNLSFILESLNGRALTFLPYLNYQRSVDHAMTDLLFSCLTQPQTGKIDLNQGGSPLPFLVSQSCQRARVIVVGKQKRR